MTRELCGAWTGTSIPGEARKRGADQYRLLVKFQKFHVEAEEIRRSADFASLLSEQADLRVRSAA